MIQSNHTLSYPHGLHARPATMLVKAANNHAAKITLEFKGEKVNAKSIMGVLSLGIPEKALFKLTFEGEDEEAAYKDLNHIILEINQLPKE
jgi:phosphocarrier protein